MDREDLLLLVRLFGIPAVVVLMGTSVGLAIGLGVTVFRLVAG